MRLRYALLFLTMLFFKLTNSIVFAQEQNNIALTIELNSAITGAFKENFKDAVAVAEDIGARLIIVMADTPGGEINAVKQIMELFEASSIPVCFYVYPEGASAWSGGTYLLMASHIAVMSSGTSIGSAQPILTTGELINDTKHINALSALIVNHAQLHGRNRTAARFFVTRNLNLGPEDALIYNVIEIAADGVPALLEKLSEKTLCKVGTGVGTSMWKLVRNNETINEKIIINFFFSGIDEAEIVEYRPSVQSWLLQILYDPTIASIMFTAGFYILFIGIQTPGLGAEFIGGLMLLLSLMAFQVIGIEPMAFMLLVIGLAIVIAELKIHSGFLGFAGGICIFLGSVFMVPSPHWLLASEVANRIRNTLLGTSIILFSLFSVIVYKVSKIRRLKIMTGREALVGEVGVVTSKLEPLGEIRIGGDFWRARSDEASIDVGLDVVVVRIEGLLLVVRLKE